MSAWSRIAGVAAAMLSMVPLPTRMANLGIEQAPPSWMRDPYGSHPAAGLTPPILAQILRSSIVADPMRYLELAEDMEERFPQYGSVIGTRKRQVAGLEFTVEPKGEDAADIAEAEFVREVVESAKFRLSKIDQLDAISKGYSCVEIIWGSGDGRWFPIDFKYRDPRFFTFDRNDPEKILLRGNGGMPEELEPWKWLVHRARAKSGLTVRGGLARQVAWPFLFHSFNLKDWAIFAEAYGQPIRLGKYDKGASVDDKRALIQALRNIGTDFAAIIPIEAQIELIKAEISGSTDLYERRATFIDKQVSKIVLGQTGTTDEMKGGYALGKVHDEVRDDIKDSDAEQWAATLNEQLVPALIGFNFGQRARKGLPEICIGRAEQVDVDKTLKVIESLGLEVKKSEAYSLARISIPDANDDVVTPRATPATPIADQPTQQQTAAARRLIQADAIDRAIDAILGAGNWEELVAPMGDEISVRLAAASTPDEARAALADAFAGLDTTALTDKLAQAMFAARLAGEAGEDLA